MNDNGEDYCRDVARACAKHLSRAEQDFVLWVAFEHCERFLAMWRATCAGRRIGGATAEEAEARLAQSFLRCAEEAMRAAPGGAA